MRIAESITTESLAIYRGMNRQVFLL